MVSDDNSSVVYTPPSADFSGEVAFTYTVCLDGGTTCDVATVTITVTATPEVSCGISVDM